MNSDASEGKRPRGRPVGSGKPMPVVPLVGLHAARTSAALSLSQCAEVIGVTKDHMAKIERGVVRLDVARAVRLARWIGVSVESFL